MKKIAIAIPTYNRNNFLDKLLGTIAEKVEVSVSDNGNFVNETIKEKYKNVFYTIHDKPIDIFFNWNSAINGVKGAEFLAIPSDDDLYIKDKFEVMIKAINQYDADIYIFGNQFIDENDEVIGNYCPDKLEIFEAGQGFNRFIYGVNVRMPSVVFKKEFLEKIGKFDAHNFTLTAADSELVQRALLLGKSVFIPEVVSSYRVWSGSLTDQRIASKHWMSEVDLWTKKIRDIAFEKKDDLNLEINWHQYSDEVFARNLLGGLVNLYRAKKYKELISHFKSIRYPRNALLKTKVRIFQYLLLSFIKQLYAR